MIISNEEQIKKDAEKVAKFIGIIFDLKIESAKIEYMSLSLEVFLTKILTAALEGTSDARSIKDIDELTDFYKCVIDTLEPLANYISKKREEMFGKE